MTIIAIDPGREKCGIAAVASDTHVLCQQVIDTESLAETVKRLITAYAAEKVIMGNGTSHHTAQYALEEILAGTEITLELVDEYRTTDAAKIRYWENNPPRGLWRIVPTTMQVPPVPVDDYVAVILAERYLQSHDKK